MPSQQSGKKDLFKELHLDLVISVLHQSGAVYVCQILGQRDSTEQLSTESCKSSCASTAWICDGFVKPALLISRHTRMICREVEGSCAEGGTL